MPCRDWDTRDFVTVEVDRPETVAKLCACLRLLEKHSIPIPLSCVKWWEAHKKEDAARRQAEKERLVREEKRKQILSKLTREDKKILGLGN